MGADSVGNERSGEIILQHFRTMPDAELRKKYMRVIGKDMAALRPYIHNIDEIHFWEKKKVDLRAEGLSESQEAIIVNGVSVSRKIMGTHAFIRFCRNFHVRPFEV